MKKQKSREQNLARERKIIFAIILAAIVTAIVLLSSFSLALAAESSYCCEKTIDGKWCQNALQSQCDADFKTAPTSCDSTSYCKPGCCFNEVEGNCMESTPQRVCEESNGIWANNQQCEIPQCNLGCCIMGDQGAFVTLTRCKTLSGYYGLKTDFRTTITDELTCIATAQSADKGACVIEDTQAGVKTCTFTTREACPTGDLATDNINLSAIDSNKTSAPLGFYKDILCTAPELGVKCGKSTKTAVIAGKDEVYFTDTCGNIANIYDSNKWNDNSYWRNVKKKSESCGYGNSNAGSKTCGNCDYFEGSIARKATRSTGFPTIGDYICIDLSCKAEGKRHGESWCVIDEPSGNGEDKVGSRYYKEVCLFNEVITEACQDYRNQICIEGDFGGFSEAACRTNRWQDCMQQKEQGDCENVDIRDCIWKGGYYFSANTGQIEKSNNDTGKGELTPNGLCVPNYPPGLTFWGSQSTTTASGLTSGTTGNFSSTTPGFQGNTPAFGTGYVNPSSVGGSSAITQCAAADAKVTFKWQREDHPAVIPGLESLIGEKSKGDWECADGVEGDTCRAYIAAGDWSLAEITDGAAKAWAADMNAFCAALGDCGGKANFVGVETDEGYAAYHGQERIAGSGGSEILEKTNQNTPTAGTPTTSGSSSTTTSDLANIAKTATGSATSPIQGAVIRDYFIKLFGGAR